MFASYVTLSTSTAAAISSNQSEVCDAIGSGKDCAQGGHDTANVDSILKTVINIFSTLVGVVAVIMIIFAGFKYITSAGDSSKITSAKNTLIYALIGVIIVALAQFIVKFVLDKSINTTQKTVTCAAPKKLDAKTNTCK